MPVNKFSRRRFLNLLTGLVPANLLWSVAHAEVKTAEAKQGSAGLPRQITLNPGPGSVLRWVQVVPMVSRIY